MNMRKRKIPLRKCVATNEMKPKQEMVRIVKSKEGEVAIDRSGKLNGRGAYISLSTDAVQKAQLNKALEQALATSLDEEFYNELTAYVQHQIARMSL